MPRKKITSTENEFIETPVQATNETTEAPKKSSVRKSTPRSKKTVSSKSDDFDGEIELSFRPRTSPPSRSATDKTTSSTEELDDIVITHRPAKQRLGNSRTPNGAKQPRRLEEKETPKPTQSSKQSAVEPVVLSDEESEIVAMFRSRDMETSKPAPREKTRPQPNKKSEPKQPQSKQLQPKPPKIEEEVLEEEPLAREDNGSRSFEKIDFEPTEVLELEDDGEFVIVQMRTRIEERVAIPVTRSPKPVRSVTKITIKEEKPPEKVVIPPRALIEPPADAPQIVDRNGQPTLVRNTHVIPNFWFYADLNSKPQRETVFDELRQAAESGIHVFVFGIEAICEEKHFDSTLLDVLSLLERVVKTDSFAQVIIRLDLVAHKGWELDYPDAVYRDDRNDLAEPSVSSDKYWSMVEKLLGNFAKQLVDSPYQSNLLGIEFDRNNWQIESNQAFDLSLSSKAKFKEWIRDRYQADEVLLRSSWFDGTVSFDTVRIPELGRRKDQNRMIRLDRKERSIADYHLFLSDMTHHRIADLAYAVKEASSGRLLVGTRYGSSLGNLMPTSGQLSLGKLLRTPEVDFVTAAPSYSNRQPNGVASAVSPVDSFALNGKLFVSLEDYKTSLSNRPEPDNNNPIIRTPQALEGVHFRGLGSSITHRTGLCWSDQWGNGWLTAASVWQRAKLVRESIIRSMAAPSTDPEVAVFVDERAMGLLDGTKAYESMVKDVQEALGRAGVSYGIYLLSDLAHREKFPESRVHIFLNAWDLRPEVRGAIKQRLHRDKKVLCWLYTAGLLDSGRESIERAREVTGIAIKPQPIFSKAGTTILDRRNPLSQAFPQGSIQTDIQLEPTYFAIPEDGATLGEYSQTGLPSFVVREVTTEDQNQVWTSVFLGETTFNTEFLRALALKAGAHVWGFQDDVIHVRAPFLTVHCKGDGQRTIALPGKWSAYNLQTKEWTVVDSTHLKFASADGVTHTFLVGTKDELRQILEADPRDLLRMHELPIRESNIRMDISNFDVPIMRMDEWVSESEVEDVVDDWYLKHNDDDYEEDASLAPGAVQRTSTGRRRRDKNNRRKKKESFAEQVDFEPTGAERLKDKGDVALDILFRKRD
jgi:hypothetical protein